MPSDIPRLLVVAGPNGSGKSTQASNHVRRGEEALDPDKLTKAIRTKFRWLLFLLPQAWQATLTNWLGVELLMWRLKRAISARRSLVFETVLASRKYVEPLKKAKDAGFKLEMVYVIVASADLNVARVLARVLDGGHDVPEDKIRNRRVTSMSNLVEMAYLFDSLRIYENSKKEGVTPLAEKEGRTPFKILGRSEAEELNELIQRLGRRLR